MALTKFTLGEEDADEFRRLGVAGDDTRPMWERVGKAMGFDPATIQQIKVEEDKPVTFKAQADEPTLAEALDGLEAAVIQNAEPEPQYDLSEAAHESMVARMAAVADQFAPRPGTLVFDVRDLLLTHIKQMERPWTGCSQGQQQDIASAAEDTATNVVRRMAELMAAEGGDQVRVLLTKIDIGDDIKITGKVKEFAGEDVDRAVMTLHHARGKHVILTVASVDDYRQGDRPAETDADQPEMTFDAGHEG